MRQDLQLRVAAVSRILQKLAVGHESDKVRTELVDTAKAIASGTADPETTKLLSNKLSILSKRFLDLTTLSLNVLNPST